MLLYSLTLASLVAADSTSFIRVNQVGYLPDAPKVAVVCSLTPVDIRTFTVTGADVIGPAGRGIAPGEFDELIRAMRNGATYVNAHTETYRPGEIRGNIRRGN